MGKGSSNEVKETAQQKALADVASQEWNRYQDVFVPLENQFIQKAQGMGAESNYKGLAGTTNTGFNEAYSQAQQQTQKGLNQAGVDPTSGKTTAAMNALAQNQMQEEGQATAQGQHNATQRYTGNLSNVMGMGKGQEKQSVAGLQEISSAATERANQRAINKANEVSIPAAAVGAGASLAAANAGAIKDYFKTPVVQQTGKPVSQTLQGLDINSLRPRG